jgi:crossover junction endodeoxyribonuclease RusA
MSGLTLPWPPSGNRYWRHSGKGVYLNPEALAYRHEVAATVWAAKGRGEFVPMGDKRLRVVATYYEPDRRRRDLDNFWKQLADALEEAGAFADDGQIDDLHLVRGGVRKGAPCVEVCIEEVA